MGLKEDYERRKAEQKSKSNHNKALHGFGRKTFRHPDRILRYAWWLGAFTFSLVVVGLIQTWAFIQSERAFVSVISLTIKGDFPKVGDTIVTIFFQTKNGGKSTAFVDYATIALAAGPLPEKPIYGNEPQRPIPPIPPDGVSYNSDAVILSRPITQADIDGIKKGTRPISIYGQISYSDTFFGHRVVGFCFMFTNQPTGASPFVACPERQYTYNN